MTNLVLGAIKAIRKFLEDECGEETHCYWHDKNGDGFHTDIGYFWEGLQGFEQYLEKRLARENMSKNILECTKEDFLSMENFMPKEPFNGIIFVPTEKIHGSGFRCMKFILENNHKIVGVVSGWSDVAHIDGIGGCGKNGEWLDKPARVVAWSIDCLPKSGCIRLFSGSEITCDDFIGSDFSFYAER